MVCRPHQYTLFRIAQPSYIQQSDTLLNYTGNRLPQYQGNFREQDFYLRGKNENKYQTKIGNYQARLRDNTLNTLVDKTDLGYLFPKEEINFSFAPIEYFKLPIGENVTAEAGREEQYVDNSGGYNTFCTELSNKTILNSCHISNRIVYNEKDTVNDKKNEYVVQQTNATYKEGNYAGLIFYQSPTTSMATEVKVDATSLGKLIEQELAQLQLEVQHV